MLLEWYGRHNLWLKNYHFRDADYSRDVRNCVNWFKVPLVETTSLSQRVVRPFTPGNHQFLFSGNTALKEFARGTFGKLKSLFISRCFHCWPYRDIHSCFSAFRGATKSPPKFLPQCNSYPPENPHRIQSNISYLIRLLSFSIAETKR